ncbi:hypothetical protein QYM36_001180 [Artemia franciscana]|uniref:RNA-directed DNA polymerase n=1 Tax=Artemia franciscana TaxID=6661 RepID=A0AA88ICF2_ARTSF|nr:hypothetical protein QYM36_001180 [Artemia franciscana]
MVRIKSLARMRVWWPNIDDDIDKKVRSCSSCQLQQSNPATFNSPWPKVTRAWERVHIDFAGPFYGKIFMIVTETFSRWIEVVLMNSMSSTASIDALGSIFSRYGFPVTLVSDNQTSFTSAEFTEFMHKNGIQLLHSPPYHPNSNGMAERAIRTFKEQIKTFSSSTEPLNLHLTNFLFHYRGIPHSLTGISPARLSLGRQLRNRLDLLKPTSVTDHKEKRNLL